MYMLLIQHKYLINYLTYIKTVNINIIILFSYFT